MYFADTPAGSTSITDNLAEVVNAGSGDNLIGSEAEIEYDESIQQNVLKITSVHPEWWYQALRLHTDAKLGTNKKLNLRMRFDKDTLEVSVQGEQPSGHHNLSGSHPPRRHWSRRNGG